MRFNLLKNNYDIFNGFMQKFTDIKYRCLIPFDDIVDINDRKSYFEYISLNSCRPVFFSDFIYNSYDNVLGVDLYRKLNINYFAGNVNPALYFTLKQIEPLLRKFGLSIIIKDAWRPRDVHMLCYAEYDKKFGNLDNPFGYFMMHSNYDDEKGYSYDNQFVVDAYLPNAAGSAIDLLFADEFGNPLLMFDDILLKIKNRNFSINDDIGLLVIQIAESLGFSNKQIMRLFEVKQSNLSDNKNKYDKIISDICDKLSGLFENLNFYNWENVNNQSLKVNDINYNFIKNNPMIIRAFRAMNLVKLFNSFGLVLAYKSNWGLSFHLVDKNAELIVYPEISIDDLYAISYQDVEIIKKELDNYIIKYNNLFNMDKISNIKTIKPKYNVKESLKQKSESNLNNGIYFYNDDIAEIENYILFGS